MFWRLLNAGGICLFMGCATTRDYHAIATRILTCDVTAPNQMQVADARTGYPLFSQPHRVDCYVDAKGNFTWIVENSSEASLQALSDLPSTIISNGIPKSTIGY